MNMKNLMKQSLAVAAIMAMAWARCLRWRMKRKPMTSAMVLAALQAALKCGSHGIRPAPPSSSWKA